MKGVRLTLLALVVATSACSARAVESGAPPSPIPSPSPSPTSPANALPSLLYDTVSQAHTALSRLKLQLRLAVAHHFTVAFRPGTVLAQKPAAGTPMKAHQTVSVTVSAAPACDPSYPTVCIPPFKGHLECKDITFRNFQVRPPDTYHFDKDHNGIGCPKVIKPPKPKHSP